MAYTLCLTRQISFLTPVVSLCHSQINQVLLLPFEEEQIRGPATKRYI